MEVIHVFIGSDDPLMTLLGRFTLKSFFRRSSLKSTHRSVNMSLNDPYLVFLWWFNQFSIRILIYPLCALLSFYNLYSDFSGPDELVEWIERPSSVLVDHTLVESNQWLQNWYFSLPSLAFSINRIGQGLVSKDWLAQYYDSMWDIES